MGAGFNLPATASRLLGCIPVVSAVDGSGFAHSISGQDAFEVDARVDAVCAAAPNLIVTIGSLNSDKVVENNGSSGAKITEAVKSFVTKVRAKLPQVPIVMVGPEPSSLARLQSQVAHLNVEAQKAGVAAAGGIANGVAFVDWLGIADKQAVPWRDGRVCATGDVVVYGGVAYQVTQAWVPASGVTPLTTGAPTVQVSDVLSGTGNEGRKVGDGTRDTLLMSDDTHPTKIGAIAFGAAAAKHIEDAVASLATWIKAQGPVTPDPPATPPTPQPQPGGDGLPIMAWLQEGWGTSDRGVYSMADLQAVAALKPDKVALPIRTTLDATDAAVAIPGTVSGKKVSDSSLNGLNAAGADVAAMIASLDMFEAANVEVLPNIRDGLSDNSARYYKSSDGKLLPIISARPGKTYSAIHGRGQSNLRDIMKTDYPSFKRVVDATDATADWMLAATLVRSADSGVLSQKAGATAWRAAKAVFPEGVWVLVASKDEQESAKAAAQTAGVTIVGWAVPTAEALAAIKG